MSTTDFRSADFLKEHIRSIMAFYHPRCVDPAGGFFQNFRDDGSIYDADTRHLVSSTRFVFNYAKAARFFNEPEYLDLARHGVRFLREQHRNPQTGGYAWLLSGTQVQDATNHCYGLAFVMLAYACALQAGIDEAGGYLEETWQLLERYFWSPEDGLYSDEISADWQTVSPYRGQNANMHSCEALLAAFETSGDHKYLTRASQLAHNITVRQAAQTSETVITPGGLIWEHYDSNWQVDWNYNKDNPRHLFRPWGFQPGHQTEWTKLLLLLDRYAPADWQVVRAQTLFDAALAQAWDEKYGGICYGFAPDGSVCDGDKYFWVQAETLAAAALLAERTGEARYWDWYQRIWAYAWAHMVDHQYGAWYRILDRQNRKYDELKSPVGKTDYHTMGACYDVLKVLARTG
ncbi:MAG: AGE family epimerase/isomerase [Candidatus Competibacteraceae bacterium]|nr:AGE family epimerase/isomerase [Candidatus Competibacteraceae bacterium]